MNISEHLIWQIYTTGCYIVSVLTFDYRIDIVNGKYSMYLV